MINQAEVVSKLQDEYPVEQGPVGGQEVTLDAMSKTEVELFHDDYINLVNRYQEQLGSSNMAIAQLLLDNEEIVLDVVRAVKRKAERPYQGRAATGTGVVIDLIFPQDVLPGSPTRWEQNVTAGVQNFIHDGAGNPVRFNQNSGLVILGYVNTIPDAKADAVYFEKDSRKIPWKGIDFQSMSVVPEIVPVQCIPESTLLMKVHYNADGLDGLKLIGVKVTTADKLDPTGSPLF